MSPTADRHFKWLPCPASREATLPQLPCPTLAPRLPSVGSISSAVRALTWSPLCLAAGCGTPIYYTQSLASCRYEPCLLATPDVHGTKPRLPGRRLSLDFSFHRLSNYCRVPAARHPSGHRPLIAFVVSHPGRTRPPCLACLAPMLIFCMPHTHAATHPARSAADFRLS